MMAFWAKIKLLEGNTPILQFDFSKYRPEDVDWGHSLNPEDVWSAGRAPLKVIMECSKHYLPGKISIKNPTTEEEYIYDSNDEDWNDDTTQKIPDDNT